MTWSGIWYALEVLMVWSPILACWVIFLTASPEDRAGAREDAAERIPGDW